MSGAIRAKLETQKAARIAPSGFLLTPSFDDGVVAN